MRRPRPTRSRRRSALTGRERVTITDYKSSDVRDPARARKRARESLQLQIYAMGYEALTGRLPDYRPAPLPRLRARRPGRGRAGAARQGAGEDRDGRRRDAGPRLHREAGPDDLLLLPVPGDLPVQRRDVSRLDPASIAAITFDFGNTLVPVDRAGLRAVVETTGRAVAERLGPFDFDEYLRVWSEERDRQFREEVPQFRETDLSERFVRVLARLRGMPPPAPDVALGPGRGSASLVARRDRLGARRLLCGVRRRAAAGSCGRATARAPRRPATTSRSCRTGRSRRRSTATSRRWAGVGCSGRSSSASGSASSSRTRRSSRRPVGSSATRLPRRSSTSATTGRPTSWAHRGPAGASPTSTPGRLIRRSPRASATGP